MIPVQWRFDSTSGEYVALIADGVELVELDRFPASRAAGGPGTVVEAARASVHHRVSGEDADVDLADRVAALFPRWRPGIDVAAGDVMRWQTHLVECIHAHTTQADWTPDVTPALWVVHRPADGTGASEWQPGLVLEVDELVTYDGITYRVVQAHTSQAGWHPPAVPALFEEQPDD